MSRGRSKKRTQAKGKPSRKPVRWQFLRSKLKTARAWIGPVRRGVAVTWTCIGVIVLLLGLPPLWHFFSWRLSVEPGETLKEGDPFATRFTLKNDGEFALYDVQVICGLDHVVFRNDVRFTNSLSQTSEYNVRVLDAGISTSAICYFPISLGMPLVSADITLTASYQPTFYPFRVHRAFRFQALKKSDGKYVWFPLAEK